MTHQCRHCPSPLGLQQYQLSTSCMRSYSYKQSPRGTTAVGHSSSKLPLSAMEKSLLLRWKSVLYFNCGWQGTGLAKKRWMLHRCMCDGERPYGMGKASWFGEPSGSIIKVDLLSFRILTQVEVMASRLCGISIKSFDFTLCPILVVTSITFSSITMPAPTLPEPPGPFSSRTTSESCHGLPSVQIWNH